MNNLRSSNVSCDIPQDTLEAINAAKGAFDLRKTALAAQGILFSDPDTPNIITPQQKIEKQRKTYVEMNLLEIPFTVYNNNLSKKRNQIVVENGSNITVITAVPDENNISHGLPIPFDREVLLTIMMHSQTLKDSTCIRISKYEILKTLDISISGNMYRALEETQHRLFNTVISMAEGWYDQKQKKRISTKFRILSRIADTKQGDELIWWIDPIIAESFRNNYIKVLDYDKIRLLKNPIAKFAYGLITKRLGNKPMWQRNILSFVKDVGCGHYLLLDARRRNQEIKRAVLEPLKELQPEINLQLSSDTWRDLNHVNIVFSQTANLHL